MGGREGEAGGGEGAGAAVEGDGEVAAGFDDEGVGGVSVAELHEGLGTSGQIQFEGGRAVFVQDSQLVLVENLDDQGDLYFGEAGQWLRTGDLYVDYSVEGIGMRQVIGGGDA